MDAKTFSKKMRGLPKFLEGSLQRGLKDFGTEAVDLNRAQMEKDGEDALGNKFGDYSEASHDAGYPQMKEAMGKEGGFINLNLSGDFQDAMDFRVSGQGLEIFSKDSKTGKLTKRYGRDIFGLNDKNFDIMFDDIFEHITRELTTYFI